MPEDRAMEYLDALDAAADWQPEGGDWDAYAPSYDEWDAMRLSAGQPAGDWDAYLTDIGTTEQPCTTTCLSV